MIFNRISVQPGQPVGLYYSRSTDGGATWGDSQPLSQEDIRWSDIVSYDDQTIHVIWQEFDGLVYANLSQISQDSGISWDRPLNITGVNDSSTSVTLADDGLGKLHFVQLLKNNKITTINQDNYILQDWEWTGSKWEFASSRNLIIRGKGINNSLAAEITPKGFFGVSMLVEYSDPENTIQNEILTLSRFLEEPNTPKEPMVALLSTPVGLSNANEVPSVVSTQSVDPSVLEDNNAGSSQLYRNIVGILIITIIMFVAVGQIIRKRNLNSNI